ncbi:MAG: glycosyltransferase family 4 protein [Clostridiaceae bacterium]|nr:glycosyltransferase family 4 protein [Clostridiaceae bacterium]
MKILFLSIIAKCGVFTHVRELALYMQKRGIQPVIGFTHNSSTVRMFKVTKKDMDAMKESLNGISYFLYESDEDLLQKTENMQIDLLHAHSPIVLSAAMKVSNKLDIPYVITLHGVSNWSKFHNRAMEQAKAIIAIGPEVAKSAGIEHQKKIRIIFNGIDIEHYKPGKIERTNKSLRIIWMGRTNGPSADGATYLARAIRILRKKGIPIDAKIVGYASGANTVGMQNCGWIHDPLTYLQDNHIVFARGRALREAMACGNVGFLIGQGYGGIVKKEWFENGKIPVLSGSLKHGYAKLNSEQIVNDILHFHHFRGRLVAARKAARKIAEDNFNIKKMVDDTYLIYEEVIKF